MSVGDRQYISSPDRKILDGFRVRHVGARARMASLFPWVRVCHSPSNGPTARLFGETQCWCNRSRSGGLPHYVRPVHHERLGTTSSAAPPECLQHQEMYTSP